MTIDLHVDKQFTDPKTKETQTTRIAEIAGEDVQILDPDQIKIEFSGRSRNDRRPPALHLRFFDVENDGTVAVVSGTLLSDDLVLHGDFSKVLSGLDTGARTVTRCVD